MTYHRISMKPPWSRTLFLDNLRPIINGVELLASYPKEPAFADCRPRLPNLTALEVQNKVLLKLAHGLVVILDEVGELAHAAADVHGCGGVGHT